MQNWISPTFVDKSTTSVWTDFRVAFGAFFAEKKVQMKLHETLLGEDEFVSR